ncbi:DUF885 domain-containing protein [Pleionea sediminis]|uniref:DUF885 domain-containing protein n=1 Tax=Pleionea sediminis TaxID=2569479 RepID=UPI001185FA03|nr:DUF885 domain-containing protein [Pleionea sediminis]
MRKLLLLFVSLTCSMSGFANTSESLHELFEKYSSYVRDLSPRVDHPLNEMSKGGFADISPQAYQQQVKTYRQLLSQLKSIDRESLSEQDKVNFDMFDFRLTSDIENIVHESYLFPMYGDTGFYFDLLRMGETAEIKTKEDAIFYIEKIEAIDSYFKRWQSNLELGVKKGKLMPDVVLVDFEKPLERLVSENIEEHPLMQPLDALQKIMNESDAQKLYKRAVIAIDKAVEPAVHSFVEFLVNDYLPQGRKSIAIYDIPGGDAYYRSQIKYYTTLSLSADKVHAIGMREVDRIRQQMMKVIQDAKFKGSFSEFIEYLRTDPKFYAKSPEELLKEAAYIAKKMDGALPRFFTKLPRQPYTVEPVPASIAPRYTTGRYVDAPLDSQRPGTYWVNTYALDKRPLYVLEALTLHEAVPGHHLQNALTKELQNLPKFRRDSYLSAYGEGWALYCEKLGIEAGFYQSPYSEFGRLSYEMWRAIRLVVDTGMHAKGWSREKAIQFMEDNTALSKHNVKTEIDRYIAWPGQALSYKMGELKILELREKAEQRLGKQFDIRAFHDEILSYGPVTLPILEKLMNQWIEKQADV